MRTIDYAPEAMYDLKQIFAYLNEHSTTAASELADRIDQRVEIVAAHPGIGRDRGDLLEGMRSVVVKEYVIFILSNDSSLEIVRALHGFRDIDSIFLADTN
jgi:toxin ParE1/3/4